MKADDKGHPRVSICTHTAVEFFPLHAKGEISLPDIANALSKKCRFTGHSLQFYSVAQHCVEVSKWLEAKYPGCVDLALWGLFHDAGEAYLPDFASPVKRFVYFKHPDTGLLEPAREIERRLMFKIAQKIGLVWPEPPEVKEADFEVFKSEAILVMPRAEWWDALPPEMPSPPAPQQLPVMDHAVAKVYWWNRYNELMERAWHLRS